MNEQIQIDMLLDSDILLDENSNIENDNLKNDLYKNSNQELGQDIIQEINQNTNQNKNQEINQNTTKIIKNHPTTKKEIGDINKLSKEDKEKYVQDFIRQIINKLQKEKILVIDRFEGNFAVCEDRETEEMSNIEISKLPEGIKEGDVLRYKNNKYEIDEEKRKEIEERINSKLKNLFND